MTVRIVEVGREVAVAEEEEVVVQRAEVEVAVVAVVARLVSVHDALAPVGVHQDKGNAARAIYDASVLHVVDGLVPVDAHDADDAVQAIVEGVGRVAEDVHRAVVDVHLGVVAAHLVEVDAGPVSVDVSLVAVADHLVSDDALLRVVGAGLAVRKVIPVEVAAVGVVVEVGRCTDNVVHVPVVGDPDLISADFGDDALDAQLISVPADLVLVDAHLVAVGAHLLFVDGHLLLCFGGYGGGGFGADHPARISFGRVGMPRYAERGCRPWTRGSGGWHG